jgi:hypothetical protein
MIGQFIYTAGAPQDHIVLDLTWRGAVAEARVSSPEHVIELFERGDVGVRQDDEFMSLPIALGYAVLLAGLSQTALVVTGDRSAWPCEWGELLELQQPALRRARSH